MSLFYILSIFLFLLFLTPYVVHYIMTKLENEPYSVISYEEFKSLFYGTEYVTYKSFPNSLFDVRYFGVFRLLHYDTLKRYVSQIHADVFRFNGKLYLLHFPDYYLAKLFIKNYIKNLPDNRKNLEWGQTVSL